MKVNWSDVDNEISKAAALELVHGYGKDSRQRIRAVFEVVAFGLALALVWLALGCRTQLDPGPYNGNTFLFNSDRVIVESKEDLSGFLKWEQANRSALTEHNLQSVTKAADAIRLNAPFWLKSAVIVRNNYSNSLAMHQSGETIAAASNSLALNISTLKAQTLSTRALTNSVNLK